MLKILKIDLKRAFLNWPVWVGAVLIFLFLLSRLYEDISRAFATNFTQMVDSSLIMFKYALHTSGAVYLFPILCVIPLGTAFCDDYETGFYKLNLLRASPNRYLLSKSLSIGQEERNGIQEKCYTQWRLVLFFSQLYSLQQL